MVDENDAADGRCMAVQRLKGGCEVFQLPVHEKGTGQGTVPHASHEAHDDATPVRKMTVEEYPLEVLQVNEDALRITIGKNSAAGADSTSFHKYVAARRSERRYLEGLARQEAAQAPARSDEPDDDAWQDVQRDQLAAKKRRKQAKLRKKQKQKKKKTGKGALSGQ